MMPLRSLWIAFLVILLVLPACSPSAAPTAKPAAPTEVVATPLPAEPTHAAAETAQVVLTLVGPEETQTFTLDELKALKSASGQAGMKSSTGKISVPAEFTGLLLADLLDRVGGLSPEYGVSVVASDGYAMTLSYDQIMKGDFITYDPSDGSEKKIDEPLQVMVAYAMEGQSLDAQRDGTLRLVIISEHNNQVTDGHWSVKWVERLEVQPLVQEWTLSMDGARDEVIDRNTFQSCSATSCHQSTWTDEEGQVWTGVPLYLLAGRVDDEVTHDGPAYNRDLAEAGYVIELVVADGYSTTVEAGSAYYNRKILVANQVDDSSLPERYFPLRLVGEGLDKSQRVGSLQEIRLLMEDVAATLEPTPVPTIQPASSAEPPAGNTLWVTGQAANSLALNDTALHALQVTTITAEHPKKGPTSYEGISLNTLLSLASPLPGATSLVLTAADGYSIAVELPAVLACKDCLVAFMDTAGKYQLVMPGFESSAWVKEISRIEIQ